MRVGVGVPSAGWRAGDAEALSHHRRVSLARRSTARALRGPVADTHGTSPRCAGQLLAAPKHSSFDPSHPYQPINYLLPASPESDPSMDFPALSVSELKQTIAQQPQQNKEAASQVIDALSNVGGFLSAGGLQVSFEGDTAIISFAVQLPEPFNGNGGPVTAQVVARVGTSEPFHVVYGYLGNTSGGANIDLGPFQLDNFGICYREQCSADSNTDPSNPDPPVDPFQRVTGIDDSGFGHDTWLASGDLNITGAVNVVFRPGPDFTAKGCSKSVPLGFAFTGGHLAQAGAFVDVSAGGVPVRAGQAQALISHGPSGTGGVGVCGTVSLFNGGDLWQRRLCLPVAQERGGLPLKRVLQPPGSSLQHRQKSARL